MKHTNFDKHFKMGVGSIMTLPFSLIVSLLVFWIVGDLPNVWHEIFIFLIIDTAICNGLYIGWEFCQLFSYLQAKQRMGIKTWPALKLWWKERSYDTFMDIVADNLGRAVALMTIAFCAYMVIILDGRTHQSLM